MNISTKMVKIHTHHFIPSLLLQKFLHLFASAAIFVLNRCLRLSLSDGQNITKNAGLTKKFGKNSPKFVHFDNAVNKVNKYQ